MKTILEKTILEMSPCEDGLEWLWAMVGSGADTQTIWDHCPRGDWMLWLLGKVVVEPGIAGRRQLAYTAAECALLALPIFEERYSDDTRPRKAIDAARRGSIEECLAAASAASAASAAYDAFAASAASAAASAAYAASAASAAASAASAASADASAASAAYAAYAASAASAAVYSADRCEYLAKCADIVRRFYPRCPEVL